MKKKGTKNKQKKLSLFKMLIMLTVLPLVISISIISVNAIMISKRNMEEDAKDTLYVAATNLATHCTDNDINVINIGDFNGYLDSLKDNNIEMAILLDDSTVATSIKNENDYRIREIEFSIDLFANTEQLMAGYFEDNVVINGETYYGYCVPIMGDGALIGIAFAGELTSNVTKAATSLITTFAMVGVVLIIGLSVVTILFSRGLTKSFAAVGKNVDALAQGDLTTKEINTSSVKEMSNLFNETDKMQQNLSETISQVKYVSMGIVDGIVDVTSLSESSNARAKHISSAMEELSETTMVMAENVQDINLQMMEIGNCVNDISENVEHLNSSAGNIVRTNEEAKVSMDSIMKSTKESVNAVNDITDQIRKTNDSIAEIDKAVQLILSISEETNLLSLNASIEAARAGEAGRGFAVVAEEIRGLSEESARGAEMIQSLAKTITDMSEKSVQLAEGIRTLMMEEQENVTHTQKKYEELSNDINASVDKIKAIAEKTEYLSDYKAKVIEDVQGLSAISEENAASSEEVNANVCEIIAEVQSVNTNCEKMNEMAKELEESVSYFKI